MARIQRRVGVLKDHLNLTAVFFSRRRFIVVTSSPATLMLPAAAGVRRRIARAIVDLPEPDSPTRPKVLPGAMEKVVPLTALIGSGAALNRRRRPGNST